MSAPNLVLVGPMGVGKTTVGTLLAQRLDRPFVDTDALVERAAGKPIAAIFDTDGEDAFRAWEVDAVQAVAERSEQVVAVGGGAVCDARNVARLRDSGLLVWLDGEPTALAARVATQPGTRPLLAGHEEAEARLAELRARRARHYQRASSARIDTTGLAAEEVAAAVMAAVGSELGGSGHAQ